MDAAPITGAPCPGSKISKSNSAIILCEASNCSTFIARAFEDNFGLPAESLLIASPTNMIPQTGRDKYYREYVPELDNFEAGNVHIVP